LADLTALSRKFEFTAEEPTIFKLRVTGHLLFDRVEVDTTSSTFTVTVTEFTETVETASNDTVLTETTEETESECSKVSFTDVSEEVVFPRYELQEVTDPSTDQPVKYEVDIPKKLEGIFVYEESESLIYSKIDLSTLDISGFITIKVTT